MDTLKSFTLAFILEMDSKLVIVNQLSISVYSPIFLFPKIILSYVEFFLYSPDNFLPVLRLGFSWNLFPLYTWFNFSVLLNLVLIMISLWFVLFHNEIVLWKLTELWTGDMAETGFRNDFTSLRTGGKPL